MSCLKFTLIALWQNTTRKRLWVDNITHCRASLFGKRSQLSLVSTLQIGGDQINAGSTKEGRFFKTKCLVVVDGDGSLWNNMRLPLFQTQLTMGRIWSKIFLKPENSTVWKLWQLSIICLSRITMILTIKITGKSATTQRQSEDCNSAARRNTECTSGTKLQGIAFIIGLIQACSLEIHCAIDPRSIARLVLLSLAMLAQAIINNCVAVWRLL